MRKALSIAVIVVSALVFSYLFAGCRGDENEIAYITVDGSSTVFPVTEAVAEEFQKEFRNIRVTVGISGTGGGFKKFGNGETDISDASRPIKQSEADLCVENRIEYIELPIAFDGLAVVVNRENDWVDHMTVAELKKIWAPEAQGVILKWNQIRPEWPDAPLRLFGAGVDSGTFDYFTEVIVGTAQSSRGDFTASEDDNILVQGVAGEKYALGFFGLAYFEENSDKLKLIAVDDQKESNGKGPILPTMETVLAGTYQPLARPIFIYVSTDALEKKKAVEGFVSYYLKHAPVLSEEVGYIPLPAEVYQLAIERFSRRATGSVFLGKSTGGLSLAELLK